MNQLTCEDNVLSRIIATSAIVVCSACFDLGGTRSHATDVSMRDEEGPQGLLPFVAKGPPIDAQAGVWTWVEFEDAFCRDGSTTGILVNRVAGSRDLMIVLQGGGACFDALSCSLNEARASRSPPRSAGVLDRTHPDNPVRDWNFVYVPYCTGDVHAGNEPEGRVEGVSGVQKFVGRANMEAFLHRVAPTFADAERVLLTGSSAGGFGTAANAILVQRAFPAVKVRAVSDSGPPLSGDYIAPCLQEKWRDTWGLTRTMLADCGENCPRQDDFVFDYAQYWARVYSDRSSGLISSTEDTVIRAFLGPGTFGCRGSMLTPLLPRLYTEGLLEFRDAIGDYERFVTYYPEGRRHTFLDDDSFYTTRVGDLSLVEWFTAIVEDEPVMHAGL